MSTTDVYDANGAKKSVQDPLAPGRAAASASRPVVLSNEDKTALDAITTALTTLSGYVDGLEALATSLNGFVDGLEALDTAISGKLPATLGAAAYNASLAVVSPRSATGTMSQVASSATAVTILASNAARLGAVVVNDSTQTLYLGLSSTTPTSGLYTYLVLPGETVEVPANYTGIIKGIWASANGNAQVTEFT